MKRRSIVTIAAEDKRAGGFYFSPSTLKFFGQTLKSFSVIWKDGRGFVVAQYDCGNGCTGQSVGEINPTTHRITSNPQGLEEAT